MDNNFFSIIGKRSSTSVSSGTIPSLLGRMSNQQVISEKFNEELTSVDSVGSVPSLQTRMAPSPPRQQQTLSQRVASSTTLLERMADPISNPKGKGEQSSTNASLVTRIHPSNMATPMPLSSPNESRRKQLSSSDPSTHSPARPSPQHNATTSVNPLNNLEALSKPSTLLSPAPTAQASIGASSHVPSSLVSHISPSPGSGSSTTRSLNPVTSNPSLPNLPIFQQPEQTPVEETQTSYVQPTEPKSTLTPGPTGPTNMDVDPIEDHLTGERLPSSVANSTPPDLPHLPPPFFPLLVSVGSPSYTFSSPIKSDGITYDTLRFHMSSLWEESEAQAREWGEVAEQRARSRLNDIHFEIRSPSFIQMKRGREEDSSFESINLLEDAHAPKRQRVVGKEEESLVQPAGPEQIAMSITTQEAKEHRNVSIDEAPDTLQAGKPLVDEARQIAKTVHIHSPPPQLLPPDAADEDAASEQDEQGEEEEEEEEENAEAERRAAEERTRIAVEKAKEMRKYLEQELAIQRREQEREKQEHHRKKEELEREAQRLREDIIKRKSTKAASALSTPIVHQASTVVPEGPPTTMRHPLPPKPAICGVNINSGIVASQPSIGPIVGNKKSPTVGRPPSTTYIINTNVPIPPHPPNLSPVPTGNIRSLTNSNTFESKPSRSSSLSMPANPMVQSLPKTTTSTAYWPPNQHRCLSTLPGKPNISQEINDDEERKNTIREENNHSVAQTASASASTENVSPRMTKGFNEVVSSQSVQGSLPVPVFDAPTPSSATLTDTIQDSTPLPLPDCIPPAKGVEKSSKIEASAVSPPCPPKCTSPITQVKKETMSQDDSATPSLFTNFGPAPSSPPSGDSAKMTNVESSETKVQLARINSGPGNLLILSDSTTIKVEPLVEMKKSPTPTPSLPMKRQHSLSEEPMVLKRRRDNSIGELEYPETTALGNPEVVQSEDKQKDRSLTPLPINIPLETLPQLPRRSPDGRRRSRSRTRSLSRETDRARTPPRGPDYYKRYPPRNYKRRQNSRSVSPPPRGRSLRRRSPSPIYDHWSPTDPEEAELTYPSHSSYRPEPQYRSKHSRSRLRSPSFERTKLPVTETPRPVPSGPRFNSMRGVAPYTATDRGSEFAVNPRPNYTANKDSPPKPYHALVEDKVLVPSPPPPRFPVAPRRFNGSARPVRSSLRRSTSLDRPESSRSRELSPDRTTKLTPPASPPSPSRLADRISTSRGRGVPRGRGNSPWTRRTKLADRLTESRVGGGSLKDRIGLDERVGSFNN